MFTRIRVCCSAHSVFVITGKTELTTSHINAHSLKTV